VNFKDWAGETPQGVKSCVLGLDTGVFARAIPKSDLSMQNLGPSET